MGGFDELDHARLVAPLDLVGFDNYAPPGWTPAQQAMVHDRMRGLLGRGHWVLEQQCGPTTWAPVNPAPAPGQIRLWTYQALAHGADGVLYFRWRAGQVGAEQLHGGILPHDGEPGRIYAEIAETARELAALPALDPPRARVALLYGEESRWALRHQPHHHEVDPDAYDLPYYEALRARGLDVDVLPPTADFSRYEVVVAGSPYVVADALLARLEAYEGTLILGPRSGFKDGHNRVRPHALRQLTGARVLELDAAEPPWGLDFGGVHVPVETLFERLETQAEVLARYPDGSPGVTRRGRVYYVGAVGRELADHVIGLIFGERTLPEGVELARRGAVTFVLNHGRQPIRLGELALPPLGVAVLRD
jgi:beta-galactosidase